MDYLTAVADWLAHVAATLGEFISSRPILGVILLTALTWVVLWEATHPPAHPHEEER
jgi:hypothetical protein